MRTITATNARRRFGQLLEMARSEPVAIESRGRSVAVLLSPEEYERLTKHRDKPGVRPIIEELLQRSIERHRSVYEALAKLD